MARIYPARSNYPPRLMLNRKYFNPNPAGIFVSYFADNPSLQDFKTDETFAPATVNVTNNTITLVDTGWVHPTGDADASRVYFESTGTLPAPLQANTPYYIAGNGGVYKVYPTMGGTDYQNIPGMLAIENNMPAQNMFSQANEINFTDQGIGTHRCYSLGLVRTILDDTGNGFNSTISNATGSKHAYIEVGTDEYGYKYFDATRPGMDPNTGTYNKYGKCFPQQGSSSAPRMKTMGARCVGFTAVAYLRLYENRSYKKETFTNADISGSIFTKTAHGFLSFYRVKFQASNGTIPAEFDPNTWYYIRPLSGGNTFSIHPTKADAQANTNAITPTAVSGNRFVMYSDQQAGDGNRWGFWQEWYVPTVAETNLLSARISQALASAQMEASNTWFVSGVNNGAIAPLGGVAPDLTKISLWFPEGCDRPVRNDTGFVGVPLASGEYWLTNSSTPRGRLHKSLEDAQASVGLTTQQCVTNGTVIHYQNVAPFGLCLFNYATGTVNHSFGTEGDPPHLPGEEVFVVTYLRDLNNPAYGHAINKLYLNGLRVDIEEMTDAKGNVPTGSPNAKEAWNLWNSPEEHVPLDGRIYAQKLMASANEITDSSIVDEHISLMQKYSAHFPSIPPNTYGTLVTEGNDIFITEGGDNFVTD